MIEFCCIYSKRRKKRGLPLVGDKASKDGKKAQTLGKVGETSGKDKFLSAGKPVDVRKSHESENVKSTAASLDMRADGAVLDEGDPGFDDRFNSRLLTIDFVLCILS